MASHRGLLQRIVMRLWRRAPKCDAQHAEYSPDNWAHQALLLMDEADTLVRWASVSADPGRYKRGADAFWAVCHMLADERDKLHNASFSREPERSGGESAGSDS